MSDINPNQEIIDRLKHYLNVPTGVTVEFNTGNAIELSGDTLVGFKAGITLAIMEMSNKPKEIIT